MELAFEGISVKRKGLGGMKKLDMLKQASIF